MWCFARPPEFAAFYTMSDAAADESNPDERLASEVIPWLLVLPAARRSWVMDGAVSEQPCALLGKRKSRE